MGLSFCACAKQCFKFCNIVSLSSKIDGAKEFSLDTAISQNKIKPVNQCSFRKHQVFNCEVRYGFDRLEQSDPHRKGEGTFSHSAIDEYDFVLGYQRGKRRTTSNGADRAAIIHGYRSGEGVRSGSKPKLLNSD